MFPIAKPAHVAPYGHIIRHKTNASCGGLDPRLVATCAQTDAGNAAVPTANFEACEFDTHALQPHWGSKMISEVLNGTVPDADRDLSIQRLLAQAREAVTTSAERLRSLSEMDREAGSLNELRSKLSSSMDFEFPSMPSMPSVELPSVDLPSMPSVPSLPSFPSVPTVDFTQKANVVTRAKDMASHTYQKAYESTQNVIADRVDRLSSDISSITSKNIENITPDAVQRAAMNVVDDLHAIKGALDDHNLVFLPTLRDAIDTLSLHAQPHPHFGTEILVALSRATAADAAVLLSELGRFIGIGKAVAMIVDILVI